MEVITLKCQIQSVVGKNVRVFLLSFCLMTFQQTLVAVF